MRSGSPAHDGGGWPSSQRPYSGETGGNPGRYGSGAGRGPQEGPAGRREAPFGPEISWPYGFRQMDPEARELLESAYGTGPRYQQPAMDDYGYGDPGYSVPDTRDSARSGYSGPGYQRPESGPRSGGQEIWPVTGAQEALPDTGPQPEIRGGASRADGVAYPEQWYD